MKSIKFVMLCIALSLSSAAVGPLLQLTIIKSFSVVDPERGRGNEKESCISATLFLWCHQHLSF